MEIKNFAIIKGNSISISNNVIKYDPSKNLKDNKTKIQNDDGIDIVTLKSDIVFGNGELEFKMKTSSFNTGIVVVLNSSNNKKIRCGYSRTWNQFLITVQEGSSWKSLCSAGNISNYNLNEELKFKIEIVGSQVNLLINNIVMCTADISIKEAPIEMDLSGDGAFELYDIKIIRQKPKVFVVMQFSKEYDELYEEVIRPISEKFGYECIRADEYYTGTPILSDIIASIKESNAIIAEITPDNPNVFYEIGYSHAIGKPTILLCDKKREKLPFDLSGFRTLFYDNTISGKKKVENSLIKYLENL